MEENGEGTHGMQTEDNLEERESHDPQGDVELGVSQKNGKVSKGNSEKRRKRKVAAPDGQGTPKKPEVKEATTPLIDRPARERKSIERFADSVEKEKDKPKEFKIEQGSGTYLRDIPNVVFKLSKRKTSDESVQLLHKLLFNKRVKPNQVKANILQFSGFVWGPNEEKEKVKMKEKLEKIVKENLFQLSDLLDLSITKTTKKEDVVLRVFDFLECPRKTTDKLVQEEEQRLKEKKRTKSSAKGKRKKGSSQTPRKRQKQEDLEEQDEEVEEDEQEEEAQEEPEEELEEEQPEEVPVKKKSIRIKEPSRDAKSTSAKKTSKRSATKSSNHVEDVDEDAEEPVQEPEEVEAEHEEDQEEPKRKRPKNKKYEDDAVPKSPKKGVRKSVKKKSVYEPGEEDLDDDVKDVKSKPLSKVSTKEAPTEIKALAGSSSKEKKKSTPSSSKASSRKKKKEHDDDAPEAKSKKGRGASQSASKEESESSPIPPDEDLRAAICELLREADFSTVTFTDVVKQLGAKFSVDLSQNKAHVKTLIQEEISKIVDEDDGDGGNEDEETGVNTPERGEKEPIEVATED